MTEGKEKLKEAAFSLAMIELKGRLLYRRYRQAPGSVNRANLRNLQKEWETQLRRLDALRSAVPECVGKRYWWDVPYDVEAPLEAFESCLSLPQGIYLEQDNFAEYQGGFLDRAEQKLNVAGVLSTYLNMSDYVVLYADRKQMKANLTASVSIRAILCCEEALPEPESIKGYQGKMPHNITNSSEYQRMQDEVRSISANLSENISAFDRRQDLLESLLNAATGRGPFTDLDSWLMGRMDSDSYYTTALYRDYRQNEMKEKARDEISRLEYQMEEMRKQDAKAQTERQQYELWRAKAKKRASELLKMIRCGYVFYLKEELVGIVIINSPEIFWQIRHQGNLSPYNIYGGMDEAKELGYETPDPAPLMEHILREYGPRLKPYSVLASCPKNASDEIWRCWAEKRFAFYVEQRHVNVEIAQDEN